MILLLGSPPIKFTVHIVYSGMRKCFIRVCEHDWACTMEWTLRRRGIKKKKGSQLFHVKSVQKRFFSFNSEIWGLSNLRHSIAEESFCVDWRFRGYDSLTFQSFDDGCNCYQHEEQMFLKYVSYWLLLRRKNCVDTFVVIIHACSLNNNDIIHSVVLHPSKKKSLHVCITWTDFKRHLLVRNRFVKQGFFVIYYLSQSAKLWFHIFWFGFVHFHFMFMRIDW